jgi:hypothetical protein
MTKKLGNLGKSGTDALSENHFERRKNLSGKTYREKIWFEKLAPLNVNNGQ